MDIPGGAKHALVPFWLQAKSRRCGNRSEMGCPSSFFATVPFYLLAEERGQAIQRELNDSGSFGECYFQVGDVLSEDDIKVGENWEK